MLILLFQYKLLYFSIKLRLLEAFYGLRYAALERPITEHVKISVRYRHENDISNVDVFDYDRNIVGGFLTLEFGSL